MPRNRWVAAVALVLVSGFQAAPARAEFGVRDMLFHFRLGSYNANYSIVTGKKSNSIPTSMDIEFEKVTSARHSYYIHTLLAYSIPSNEMSYMAIGIGSRFYLGSDAMIYESYDGGNSVVSIPTLRFYFAPELAMSEVIVGRGISDALVSFSTLIEVGGVGGAIFQMGPRLGFELQTGFFYGYGFSTISANSVSYRILAGVSYFF